MKKTLVVAVCGLFVLICMFAASRLQSTVTSDTVVTTSVAMASSSNTAFGYDFSYPKNSYLVITPEDGPFGDVVFTQSIFDKKEYAAYQLSSTSQETPPSLTIAVFRNPKNLAVDDWIKESSYSNFKLSTNGVLHDVKMGDTTYRTYQWDGLYRGDEYVYAQDGYIYVLSNTWSDAQSKVKTDMETLISSVTWATPLKLAQTAHGDIVLDEPQQGGSISSPVTLTGYARGSWYFEASFPVELVNWDGEIIAQGAAHAQGDWMTQSMVPFTASVFFNKPEGNLHGSLILKKDNPSGLPERDDAIEVPILFK